MLLISTQLQKPSELEHLCEAQSPEFRPVSIGQEDGTSFCADWEREMRASVSWFFETRNRNWDRLDTIPIRLSTRPFQRTVDHFHTPQRRDLRSDLRSPASARVRHLTPLCRPT